MAALRITIGILLVALTFATAVLVHNLALLHLDYTDASDPAHWALVRRMWLAYLSSLTLLWGAGAVSLLWPRPPTRRLTRLLFVASLAAGASGLILLALRLFDPTTSLWAGHLGAVILSGAAGSALGLRLRQR